MTLGPPNGALGAVILRFAAGVARTERDGTASERAPFAHGSSSLDYAAARPRCAAPLALTLLMSTPLIGGCAVELRLGEIEDPSQATSTVSYTSVRDEGRRFPDYGSIDASILDPRAGDEP